MLNSEPLEVESYTVTPITHQAEQEVVKPYKSKPVSPLLESLGFSWLIETDTEHERMFDRPLVEELDIDLPEIWYKIRCVLLPLPQVRRNSILMQCK